MSKEKKHTLHHYGTGGISMAKLDDLELNGYNKWVIKKRIEKANRKWMRNQVAKWAGIGTFLLILFLGMLKQ